MWLHLPHMPPIQALMGQLLIGLINGAFYALLSLGLAIIFGLLNIINFAQGALYMLGAFCAYLLLQWLDVGYWPSLVIAPIVVGAFGVVLERLFLRRVYKLYHLYGLLLTSAWRSSSRASSSSDTARRARPIRSRLCCPAACGWASCICRSTAPGSSSHRSSPAPRPGF
jgi:ABC-type branched-subunit amino acid transport system permease subunit